VTAFLRTNRYASVLITMIILVVVGLIVNLTRDDAPNDKGVVLRADEQTLQSQPTVTLSQNLVDRAMGDITQPNPLLGPNLTIGTIPKVPRPTIPAGSGGSGATTTTPACGATTTQPSGGGGATTTTAAPVTPNAFALGRITYTAAGTIWTVNPDGSDRRNMGVGGYSPAWAKDHSAIAAVDADSRARAANCSSAMRSSSAVKYRRSGSGAIAFMMIADSSFGRSGRRTWGSETRPLTIWSITR
jgi:hypothetical protein